MSITPASPNNNPKTGIVLSPAPGLPPVAPPTGRFVVQLFLVPGLIVVLLVAVAYGYHYFFGLLFGSPNPDEFLHKLDDPNAEVRWRTAADLAQILLRDKQNRVVSDPDFALKLADRLEKAHANSKEAEDAFAKRVGSLSPDDAERERKKLEPERNYVQYLSACLATFIMPVGASVLQELATQESGIEPKGLYEQRTWAIWALAVLGEKCKTFDNLTPVEQASIIDRFEMAINRNEHTDWATATRDYLKARQSGKATTMGIDVALEKCATAPQPYLRELTALACNSWTGTDEENKRIETTLEKLSFDDGHGDEEMRKLVGDNPDGTSAYSTKPGRAVCYNATIALARRGSDKTRVDLLVEMLDEGQLREVFRLKEKNGVERADEALVIVTMTNALKAAAEMHGHNPQLTTEALREAVSKLTTNNNAAIANEAKKTQQVLRS